MFKAIIIISIVLLGTMDARGFRTKKSNSVSQISVGLSTLNGQSDEFVYNASGKKISELNWRLKNVQLLNIEYTKNIKVIGFGISISNIIGNPKTTMDDYDWLSNITHPDDWTHWSHHENTTVEEAYKFNLFAKFNIFDSSKGIVFLKLGYKYDTYKWVARNNADFIYTSCDNPNVNGVCPDGSTYENNFRDIRRSTTNTSVGITYQQYFSSLYLATGIDRFQPFKKTPLYLKAEIQYSNNIKADDEDTHHNRDLNFKDIMTDKGVMLNAIIEAKFVVTPTLSLALAYENYRYTLSKGYSITTYLDTGKSGRTANGAAGMSHKSEATTCKIVYNW